MEQSLILGILSLFVQIHNSSMNTNNGKHINLLGVRVAWKTYIFMWRMEFKQPESMKKKKNTSGEKREELFHTRALGLG